jgi:hypothetical protein
MAQSNIFFLNINILAELTLKKIVQNSKSEQKKNSESCVPLKVPKCEGWNKK